MAILDYLTLSPLKQSPFAGKPPYCLLENDPGICRGLITRYFFNKESMKCEKFQYGGCLGNQNNFHTLKECQDTCEDNRKWPCLLVLYLTISLGAHSRWHDGYTMSRRSNLYLKLWCLPCLFSPEDGFCCTYITHCPSVILFLKTSQSISLWHSMQTLIGCISWSSTQFCLKSSHIWYYLLLIGLFSLGDLIEYYTF